MAYKSKIAWTLYLEPALKDRLKVLADKKRRSLNNTVELLLEEILSSYEQDESGIPEKPLREKIPEGSVRNKKPAR